MAKFTCKKHGPEIKINERDLLFNIIDAPALSIRAVSLPDFLRLFMWFNDRLQFGRFRQLRMRAYVRLAKLQVQRLNFRECSHFKCRIMLH